MVNSETYQQVLQKGKEILKNANIQNYDFEIWELIRFVFKLNKIDFVMKKNETPNINNVEKFISCAQKRATGYPLQYIIGEWDFYKDTFKVGEGVLIPRSDTEILVETVVDVLKNNQYPKVADLCSGSGAIAVSIAKSFPQCELDAVELSDDAMVYLLENAKLCDRVNVINHDVLTFTPNKIYDAIVSNPPYITKQEMKSLQKEVTFEPTMALEAEENGLFFYKNISKRYQQYLSNGGYLAFEVGYNQSKDVIDIMKSEGYVNIKSVKDLCGIQRVIIGQKKNA